MIQEIVNFMTPPHEGDLIWGVKSVKLMNFFKGIRPIPQHRSDIRSI